MKTKVETTHKLLEHKKEWREGREEAERSRQEQEEKIANIKREMQQLIKERKKESKNGECYKSSW